MLQQFREKPPAVKLAWMVGLVVGLALVLSLLAHLPRVFRPTHYAGKLFGKKVSREEFQKTRQHILLLQKFRYGDQFALFEPLLDLDQQTWDQLILLKEARRQGIRVPDKDVVEAIAQYKIFYRHGQFNDMLYKQIIRSSLKTEPRIFEEAVRDSLKISRLYEKVTEGITFSEPEIQDAYRRLHNQMRVAYVAVPARSFQDQVSVSDQDIDQYYRQHRKEFWVPPSIKVDYIRADYPPNAGIQKQVETKFKAKAIYKEYNEGASLEDLTKKFKYRLHHSRFFPRRDLTFPFGEDSPQDRLPIDTAYRALKEAFRLQPGELLQPVEWAKGYLVIRLKKKRPAYYPDKKEVTDKIKAILALQKAKALAKTKAREYHRAFLKSEDFQATAKTLHLPVDQTPLLPQIQLPVQLNLTKEARKALFGLGPKRKLSPPLETPDGYLIVWVQEFQPADMNKFANDGQDFAKKFLRKKKDEAFDRFAKDLEEKAALERLTQ